MKRRWQIAFALLLTCNAVIAQDSSSKPAPLQAPTKSNDAIEVLSDTMGVDFGPYLQDVLKTVKKNWYNLTPEVARAPIMKQGTVVIEFAIMKHGDLTGMRLRQPSGDVSLDRAAWGSITSSNPFPPLPSEFSGGYLALRFHFHYNPDRETNNSTHMYAVGDLSGEPQSHDHDMRITISPATADVVAGASQQFTVTGGNSSVKWTVFGLGCVNATCGTITNNGLYTAPSEVPDPPVLTVTAERLADKSKRNRVLIKIVSAAPSQQGK